MERYKDTKKETKKAVSEARDQAYEGFYKQLDTKEGEQNIYKITRARERKTRDLSQVKCMKEETNKVLTDVVAIEERWRRYFCQLYNKG